MTDDAALAAINKACDVLGGTVAMAEELGVAPATVSEWKTGKRPVPIERCVDIEAATAKKGDRVPAYDIRRDVDWMKFRKLASPPRVNG